MVNMAFNPKGVLIDIDKILPLKKIKPSTKHSKKYKQIFTSVKEVGIIEHLIVYPQNKKTGTYMLLDGHLRLEVLKDLDKKSVHCLVSTDDEGFTYNHKVNRLSTIQEHFMILKAIEKGVSEERIAKTLNVDVSKIRKKTKLLNGITPEIVELLKDKRISQKAIGVLRKMKPIRQLEAAELMISANNFTASYAQAILAATAKNQLVDRHKSKKINGMSNEDIARIEKEMGQVEKDYLVIKDSYGEDNLNLVLASQHLSKLLDNARVIRFLSKNYSDILSEFQKIIDATSLSKP